MGDVFLSENQTHCVSAGGQQSSLAALGSCVRLASGQQVILYFSTCLEVRLDLDHM